MSVKQAPSTENEVFVIRTGPTTVSRNRPSPKVTLYSVLDKFCSNRSMVLSDFSVRKSTNFEFIEDLNTPLNKLGTSEVLLDKNKVVEEMEKFHKLVEEGNLVSVTEFYIKRSPDFDINFHGKDRGRSALHISCQHGHKNVARFLLKNGAKIDQRDGIGWYPIHCGALGVHCEVVDLLVDKGHEVNALNSDMNSAIHYLVRAEVYSSKLTKTLDNLLQRGANINITNTNGDTPLHHVVEKNRCEIVKYLLKNGSSLTVANKRNLSPLDLAQELNRKEILRIIEDFTKAPLIPSLSYDIPDMVTSYYTWKAYSRSHIYDDLDAPASGSLEGPPEDEPVVSDVFLIRETHALLARTYKELYGSTKALRDDVAEVVNWTQDSEIEIMKLQKKE